MKKHYNIGNKSNWKCGRSYKNTNKKCKKCEGEFTTSISEIERGGGKFCSLSCATSYNNSIESPRQKVRCKQCGNKFNVVVSTDAV